MMDPAELRDKIRRWIVAHSLPHEDPASLGDDTPLITGGILDEMRIYSLLGWIEVEFGFEPDVGNWTDAFDHLDSIESIARMIEGAMGRTAGEPREVPE